MTAPSSPHCCWPAPTTLRTDIPSIVEESGRDVRQADALGEDDRLISVVQQRLAEAGVPRDDPAVGVIVVAVGSSWEPANVRTARVASALEAQCSWAGTRTAFATGPRAPVEAAILDLRRCGAPRIVVAPWFLAHGRITDRVAECVAAHDVGMASPLGAHPAVAETVLARYDDALADCSAA